MFEEQKQEQRLEEKMTEGLRVRALSVLAGAVARDFNNVLYGIATETSVGRAIVDKGGDAAPKLFRDLLDRLEGAAARGADLCGQLLAYAGQIRLSIEIVDLNALTRAALEALESDVFKSAKVEFDFANDQLFVRADVGLLRQVIMNLLLNAYESLQDGRGRITLQTSRFNADAAFFSQCRVGDDLLGGDYILLKVADNGCGMARELTARIFDPFFTTKCQGRGLGPGGCRRNRTLVRGAHCALKARSGRARVFNSPSPRPTRN